jgi:hypothetical protein
MKAALDGNVQSIRHSGWDFELPNAYSPCPSIFCPESVYPDDIRRHNQPSHTINSLQTLPASVEQPINPRVHLGDVGPRLIHWMVSASSQRPARCHPASDCPMDDPTDHHSHCTSYLSRPARCQVSLTQSSSHSQQAQNSTSKAIGASSGVSSHPMCGVDGGVGTAGRGFLDRWALVSLDISAGRCWALYGEGSDHVPMAAVE